MPRRCRKGRCRHVLSVFGLRTLPRIARWVAERIGVPLLSKRG